MKDINIQEEVTRLGNPRKPQGEEGRQMLRRMNDSHEAVTEWALSFFDFRESDRVLDVGCGGGATLARIARHIRTGQVTGVDYSPVSVALSREGNAAALQSGRVEVLEASVEHLPFEPERFDKIVTVESFYFWPDPADNLKEVRRVLKTGGTFLLVADIYQKEGLSQKSLDNIQQYRLFNPTPSEFEALFRQAGFAKVTLHTQPGTDWICVEGRR